MTTQIILNGLKWAFTALAFAAVAGTIPQVVAQEFEKEILPRSGIEEQFAFSPAVITTGGKSPTQKEGHDFKPLPSDG
jgi:hypothetical protein